MTTPALNIPPGPLGRAFLGRGTARRSTPRTLNPEGAFVAAALSRDDQEASSTGTPLPRVIWGEQEGVSKPDVYASDTLVINRFLAKLELLLGTEHRSVDQNQVDFPLDFNAI